MENPNETKQPFDTFVDHQRKAMDEAGKAIEALIPEGFKNHSRNAIKESLEGFRVLFNTAIDRAKEAVDEMQTSEESKGTTGKTKVQVDLN